MTCYDELLALLNRYAPLNCTNVGAFNHQVMKWRQRNAELLTKTQESKEPTPAPVTQAPIPQPAPAPAPVSVTPPPKPAPTEVKKGPSDVSVS